MTKLTRNLIIGGSSTVVVGGGAAGAAVALLHKTSDDHAANNQNVDKTTLTAKTPEEIAKAQLQNENARIGAQTQQNLQHGFHVAETQEATRTKDAELASSISNWQKSIDLAKERLEDLKQQKNDLAKAHELRLQALELEKAKAIAEALKQTQELERVNSLANGSKYVKEIAHIDNAKDIARNIVDKEHATTGLTHAQEVQEAQTRLQALKDAEKAELARVASLREGFIKDIKNAAHQDAVALNAWSIADRNSEKTSERTQELLAAQTRLQELKDKEAQAFAELESQTHNIVPTHKDIDWESLDATLALHQAEQAKADHESALEELARLESGINQIVHQRNAEYQIEQIDKGLELQAQNVAKAELAAKTAFISEQLSLALESAIAAHQAALDNLAKLEAGINQVVNQENAEYNAAIAFNKMASETPIVNTQAPVRHELDKTATDKLEANLVESNARFEYAKELGLERLAGEEHAKELEQQGLAALATEEAQRQAAVEALTLENEKHEAVVSNVLEQRHQKQLANFAKVAEIESKALAEAIATHQNNLENLAKVETEVAKYVEGRNTEFHSRMATVSTEMSLALESAIAAHQAALDNLAKLEAGINQVVNQENAEYNAAIAFNKMASETPIVNTQAPTHSTDLGQVATERQDAALAASQQAKHFADVASQNPNINTQAPTHSTDLGQVATETKDAALAASQQAKHFADVASQNPNINTQAPVRHELDKTATDKLEANLVESNARFEYARELGLERLAGEEHAKELEQQGLAALTAENMQRQAAATALTLENEKHAAEVATLLGERQKVVFAKVAELGSKALAEAIATHQNNLENLAKVETEVAKYVEGRNTEFHSRMATVSTEMSLALESAIAAHQAALDNLAKLEAGINQVVNQENAEYNAAIAFNKMASETPVANTQTPVRHELDKTATDNLDAKLAASIARTDFAKELEVERQAGEDHAKKLEQQGLATLKVENMQRQAEQSALTTENQKHNAEVAKVLEQRQKEAFAKVAEVASKALAQAIEEHKMAVAELDKLESQIKAEVAKENEQYRLAQLHQRDNDYTKALTDLYNAQHDNVQAYVLTTPLNQNGYVPTLSLTDTEWRQKVNQAMTEFTNLKVAEQKALDNLQARIHTAVQGHVVSLTTQQVIDLRHVNENNAHVLNQGQLAAIIGTDLARTIFAGNQIQGAKVFIQTNGGHENLRIELVGPNGIVASRNAAKVEVQFRQPTITASASVTEITRSYVQLISMPINALALQHTMAQMMANLVNGIGAAAPMQSEHEAKVSLTNALKHVYPNEQPANLQTMLMRIINAAKAEAETLLAHGNADLNKLNDLFAKFQQMSIN